VGEVGGEVGERLRGRWGRGEGRMAREKGWKDSGSMWLKKEQI
jgi:hypothetical protein